MESTALFEKKDLTVVVKWKSVSIRDKISSRSKSNSGSVVGDTTVMIVVSDKRQVKRRSALRESARVCVRHANESATA